MTSISVENDNNLNELGTILTHEVDALRQIRSLLEEKQLVILSGKELERLAELDGALQQAHQISRRLEAQRRSLQQACGYGDRPLLELIHTVRGERRLQMQQTRDSLRAVASDVENLNAAQRDMLTCALSWIDDTVQSLGEAMAPNAEGYSATGNPGKQRKRSDLKRHYGLDRISTVECEG